MLSQVRQRQVLQHLRSHGAGNVAELAAALEVSPSTIRRDLAQMAEQGLLTRVHGGASVTVDDFEAARTSRQWQHHEAKRRIGEAAAALVPDGATVLITGGTTTEAMLPFLSGHRDLTVVTNGLNVAHQLGHYPEVTTVVLGGVLRHYEMSLLGPLAVQTMEAFNVESVFCGAFGIDATAGLFGADVREVATDQALLKSASTLTVLADSSKFVHRGPVRLVPLDRITRVVTDIGVDDADVRALRARGVDVVTA